MKKASRDRKTPDLCTPLRIGIYYLKYPLCFLLLWHALAFAAPCPPGETAQPPCASQCPVTPQWWKEAVFYQVYPRSFQDSDGDGIGDLKGIISRLDYIKSLGVNVIWLNPFFASPDVDNGYDISNYVGIKSIFGTMADFDQLMAEIKKRDLRLIIDLVPNHTSDQHPWFINSRQSTTNPYRDYYIWRKGNNGQPPNNYPSFFGGPAWTKDEKTNEYYLHYFSAQQPDLNWDNPKVRQEIYSVMKFWLAKGVSGFRLDSVAFLSKDPGFKDLSPAQLNAPEYVYANGPHIHDYLKEMNTEVLAPYNAVAIGEAFGVPAEREPDFIAEDRHELNMIFNFAAIHVNREGFKWKPWHIVDLKNAYDSENRLLSCKEWSTRFLSNHDNPRLVSAFGDDSAKYRVASAKALATLILTQRGTPFIYQGDELGMTNYPFTRIQEFNAPEVKMEWHSQVLTGAENAAVFMAEQRKVARDNARTPMQWDDTAHAGFTRGATTWLNVNPNYPAINARAELNDSGSVLNYYKKLIALRRNTPALVYGDYVDEDPGNPGVYIYSRSYQATKLLVVLNLSGDAVDYPLPEKFTNLRVLMTSRNDAIATDRHLRLAPWEATIYAYQ